MRANAEGDAATGRDVELRKGSRAVGLAAEVIAQLERRVQQLERDVSALLDAHAAEGRPLRGGGEVLRKRDRT